MVQAENNQPEIGELIKVVDENNNVTGSATRGDVRE